MHWEKIVPCPEVANCDCPQPSEPPLWPGQTVYTDCAQSSSISSDSESSNGSESSASQDCAGGWCLYVWTNPYGGMEVWEWRAWNSECGVYGCVCSPPGTPGDYWYEYRYGTCAP